MYFAISARRPSFFGQVYTAVPFMGNTFRNISASGISIGMDLEKHPADSFTDLPAIT